MSASTLSPAAPPVDWRVRLGVGATAIWLLLGIHGRVYRFMQESCPADRAAL